MNDKITLQNIIEKLAEKQGMPLQEAESFVKTMFGLIEEALLTERYVKIKGLGTFKLTEVDTRESIDVNTGERIEIQGHNKISFTPDTAMKELINKPFAHFETVVLNEGTCLADTEIEVAEPEPDTQGEELPVIDGVSIPEKTEAPCDTVCVEEPCRQDAEEISCRRPFPWKWILAAILSGVALCLGWYMCSLSNPSGAVKVTPVSVPVDSVVLSSVSDTLVQSADECSDTNKMRLPLADTLAYDITGTITTHTLQEGESLVKLAVKFYGTRNLWTYIVRHNQGVIKDPDRVPVGTVIRIPRLQAKPDSIR